MASSPSIRTRTRPSSRSPITGWWRICSRPCPPSPRRLHPDIIKKANTMSTYATERVLSVHHWNDKLFSFKMPDGPLTSRLQHLKVGDTVLVSRKPTGTLVIDDLKPGKNLYLFSTGTGLAAFMPIIQDPDAYERFEKIVLFHGVRQVNDLA